MSDGISDLRGVQAWNMLPHRILRWWGAHVGFRTPRQRVFTLLLVLVPFVIVGGAAFAEKGFFLGSVTSLHEVTDPETKEVSEVVCRGMSFLGDPMVWPFMILLPLTVVALRGAVRKVRRFLVSDLGPCLRPEWVAEHQAQLQEIRREARHGLQGRGAWAYLYWAALAAGLVIFGFNLLTCTVSALHPYEVHCSGVGTVHIAKWDTDCRGATLSWTAARLWVLTLGYFWVPLILARFLNVVTVVTRLLGRLGTTGRAFHVRPMHPDGACGLAPISRLTMSFVYPILFLALLGAMQFFKEAVDPALHNYLVTAAFFPLFGAAFFLPLRAVHKAMTRVRDYALRKIFATYERVSADFTASLRKPDPDEQAIASQGDALRGIREASDTLRAMPTWPFGLGTIRRLVVTALVTLAPLAAKLAGPLLKKYLGA